MIKLKCPSCARPLGIDEAYVGMQGLCPGCGATFTVPAPAVLLEEKLPPAPGPPPFPSEPLLPEGPLGLVADTLPALASTQQATDPLDPWAQTESRGRSAPATVVAAAEAPAASANPAPAPSLILDMDLLPLEPSPPLPPQEGNRAMTDWRYLALEEDQVPPAPPPPPQAAPPAAAEGPVPLLLPPAMATGNVILPVSLADTDSYDMR